MDEVVLLEPSREGTAAKAAGEFDDVKELLDGGINLADIVMPRTRPTEAEQISLFGDE